MESIDGLQALVFQKWLAQLTCDVNLQLVCTRLAAVDNFHGSVDHLVIEVSSQPALEEANMDEGPVEEHVVAPDRRMGRPPCLQLKSCLVQGKSAVSSAASA